jgi:hypothetical protein
VSRGEITGKEEGAELYGDGKRSDERIRLLEREKRPQASPQSILSDREGKKTTYLLAFSNLRPFGATRTVLYNLLTLNGGQHCCIIY